MKPYKLPPWFYILFIFACDTDEKNQTEYNKYLRVNENESTRLIKEQTNKSVSIKSYLGYSIKYDSFEQIDIKIYTKQKIY
jgi:hypothetical protein